MFVDVTPIDVFVFDADANKISERVIDAASAVPAGQDVALSVRFLADNFTDKNLSRRSLSRGSIALAHPNGACFVANVEHRKISRAKKIQTTYDKSSDTDKAERDTEAGEETNPGRTDERKQAGAQQGH